MSEKEVQIPVQEEVPKPDDSDSDSDYEIKITLSTPDLSKMTDEEREAYFNRHKTCAYCQSIGKDAEVYNGHTKEQCKILQNTRCNWCGGYGHTGKYCKNRGEKPLEIRCMFCFRAKMDERFYMSHTPERCRFKREYDDAKRNGRPVPPRPRGTQQPIQRPQPAPPVVDETTANDLLKALQALNMYDPEKTFPDQKTYQEYDPEKTFPDQPIGKLYDPEETSPYRHVEDEFETLRRLNEENQKMLAKLRGMRR